MVLRDHQAVNPPELAPAVGFAHAVVAQPGRTVWIGGQTALDAENRIVGKTFVEQFERAVENLRAALRAAGAEPRHLVQAQLFVTDAAAYRAARRELGAIWQRHLGKWYPAMALFEVKGLFDPAALVEIMAVAVIP
jgi:enamine deaminase RidA (YjgF/YER057c/UK114 family)